MEQNLGLWGGSGNVTSEFQVSTETSHSRGIPVQRMLDDWPLQEDSARCELTIGLHFGIQGSDA